MTKETKIQKTIFLISLVIIVSLNLFLYKNKLKNQTFESNKIKSQKEFFNRVVQNLPNDDICYLISKNGFLTFYRKQNMVTVLNNKKIYQKDFDEIVRVSKSVLIKQDHIGKTYLEESILAKPKMMKKSEV